MEEMDPLTSSEEEFSDEVLSEEQSEEEESNDEGTISDNESSSDEEALNEEGWQTDHFFVKAARKTLSKEKVILELQKVRGIGEAYAIELYKHGIRSVADLVEAQGIPDSIRLLAKYAEELEHEVSVKDAQVLLTWLEVTILETSLSKPDSILSSILDVIAVGAHRRSEPSMHDIDALIVCTDRKKGLLSDQLKAETSKDQPIAAEGGAKREEVPYDNEGVSEELEKMLTRNDKYLGTLSRGDWKYSFLWKLVGKATVVDLNFCPVSERGSALLHATGPAKFNILLRKRAIKMGFSLSEHGLFRVTKESKELVHAATEEGIFAALGVPFISAKERDTEDGRYAVTRSPIEGK
jgi:DNA polymerase/3'-5' exonuclease PolX